MRDLSADFAVPHHTELTELVDHMCTKMEKSVFQALEAELISFATDSATTVASDPRLRWLYV